MIVNIKHMRLRLLKMNTITTDLIKWRCLPLHLNFSSFKDSILLRCIRFGVSHRAPDVSMGFRCRYSANHRKLQSHIKGFLAKCLRITNKVIFNSSKLRPQFFTYKVCILFKESNVPFAKDWMLLSYSDLHILQTLKISDNYYFVYTYNKFKL